MALPTITLDDRTFDQLFAFMRKQIDTGEWLDHNLSDPGIALLDLLCWIGEMILYRADRIPQTHEEKFAALIVDPPEPVTVPLTLTANVGDADLVVPAGTRFATDFMPDASTGRARRFVFETIAPVTFRAPQAPPPQDITLTATGRELLGVASETLGTSNGLPNQVFPFRPVHTDLGLPLDQPAPALIDFVHRSAGYDPNPRVTVAGLPWELQRFLLTEQSHIDPVNPQPKPHYMVESDGSGIRFGDGRFGSIPPAGAAIVCTPAPGRRFGYQLLQGPAALIPAGRLVHQLDPVAGLTAFHNGDAEGGDFFFRPDERLREGLKRFRRPFRLVTAPDFERVMLVDFNEVQGLSRAPDRVSRAIALMNRKPPSLTVAASGHVTIVVLVAKPAGGQIAFAAQPGAGSTITLNGTPWAFVPGIAGGNQTQIGADLDATLTALAADLNASTDTQVARCTYTASTGTDRLEIRFNTAGADGDRFTLAASAASHGTVSAPTLTGGDLDDALTDPALPVAQKQVLIGLAPALIDKIVRFLETRRLITTRVHVEAPTLTQISITAQVAVERDRNVAEMTTVIAQRLRAFLGATRGGFDAKGWPVGGSVYRSKLFRLIEDIDGVDHVEALALTPADANGDVSIEPLSLVALAGLSVSVSRV